jgi:hypothetical protein
MAPERELELVEQDLRRASTVGVLRMELSERAPRSSIRKRTAARSSLVHSLGWAISQRSHA